MPALAPGTHIHLCRCCAVPPGGLDSPHRPPLQVEFEQAEQAKAPASADDMDCVCDIICVLTQCVPALPLAPDAPRPAPSRHEMIVVRGTLQNTTPRPTRSRREPNADTRGFMPSRSSSVRSLQSGAKAPSLRRCSRSSTRQVEPPAAARPCCRVVGSCCRVGRKRLGARANAALATHQTSACPPPTHPNPSSRAPLLGSLSWPPTRLLTRELAPKPPAQPSQPSPDAQPS